MAQSNKTMTFKRKLKKLNQEVFEIEEKHWENESGRRNWEKERKPLMKFESKWRYIKHIHTVLWELRERDLEIRLIEEMLE